MSPPPAPAGARPESLADLFFSFTLLALQGFGGVLAIVQHELVERKRWLTREEFIEDWAVAQIMPGPNVVNLSLMIGARHFGLPGALAAVAGMFCLPLVLLLVLAALYAGFADDPRVASALRGMGAVSAGLIAATGLKLIGVLKSSIFKPALCALLGGLCFIAVAVLRWPLIAVLPALGFAACALAYRRIKP